MNTEAIFLAYEGDNWFSFNFGDLCGSAKIYSEGSPYGIAHGNISKLYVIDYNSGDVVYNYDRGLEFDHLASGQLSKLLEFFKEKDFVIKKHLEDL